MPGSFFCLLLGAGVLRILVLRSKVGANTTPQQPNSYSSSIWLVKAMVIISRKPFDCPLSIEFSSSLFFALQSAVVDGNGRWPHHSSEQANPEGLCCHNVRLCRPSLISGDTGRWKSDPLEIEIPWKVGMQPFFLLSAKIRYQSIDLCDCRFVACQKDAERNVQSDGDKWLRLDFLGLPFSYYLAVNDRVDTIVFLNFFRGIEVS